MREENSRISAWLNHLQRNLKGPVKYRQDIRMELETQKKTSARFSVNGSHMCHTFPVCGALQYAIPPK